MGTRELIYRWLMFRVKWKRRHLEAHQYALMRYDVHWFVIGRWYSPFFWFMVAKTFFTTDMSFKDLKTEVKESLVPDKYDFYVKKGITADTVGKLYFYRIAYSIFDED